MAHNLKWFIREVRSIFIRNLVYDAEIQGNLPFPKLQIRAGVDVDGSDSPTPLLFSSHSIPHTSNPAWTTSSIDFLSIPDLSLECQDLSFTIVDDRPNNPTDSPNIVILEYLLDLRRVVRLGNIQLMLIDALPVNSIFLSTDNGFYISETLFVQLRSLGLIPVASRFVDDDSDITDPSVLQQQMAASTSRIDKYSKDLTQQLSLTDELDLPEAGILELERLKAEAEALEIETYIEERYQNELTAALRETSSLQGILDNCNQLKSDIAELNDKCQSKKEELLKLQFLFESRQLKLLAELSSMYPIERLESSSSSEYSIRGVELHLDTGNDEQTSTALGYIVHLLLLVSKYLEVPLRYQLLYFASRSLIKDPVAAPHNNGSVTASAGTGVQNGVILPLYRTGVDKQRFDAAIHWLRIDVEQLLQSRGIMYNPRLGILFNIQQLFSCETCLSFSS